MSFALFPSHFHILQTHASVQSNPSSITQKRYGEKHKDMKFRHLQQITWTWDKNQDHFQLHNHDTAPLHIRGMSILACLEKISGFWGYLYLDNRSTPVHPTEKLGLKWDLQKLWQQGYRTCTPLQLQMKGGWTKAGSMDQWRMILQHFSSWTLASDADDDNK